MLTPKPSGIADPGSDLAPIAAGEKAPMTRNRKTMKANKGRRCKTERGEIYAVFCILNSVFGLIFYLSIKISPPDAHRGER